VAQPDFDVAPDSNAGNYDVVSTGFAPSSTHTFRYTEVSAAGVESATSSATLTITTNADTSGGGGGDGGNGKLPTPVIASSEYSIPDQAVLFDITPNAAYPAGTVFHVERAIAIGGAYFEDVAAATTSLSVADAFSQDGIDRDRYFRLWATAAGWTDSDRCAAILIHIPHF
jgi:hypothetical protein